MPAVTSVSSSYKCGRWARTPHRRHECTAAQQGLQCNYITNLGGRRLTSQGAHNGIHEADLGAT